MRRRGVPPGGPPPPPPTVDPTHAPTVHSLPPFLAGLAGTRCRRCSWRDQRTPSQKDDHPCATCARAARGEGAAVVPDGQTRKDTMTVLALAPALALALVSFARGAGGGRDRDGHDGGDVVEPGEDVEDAEAGPEQHELPDAHLVHLVLGGVDAHAPRCYRRLPELNKAADAARDPRCFLTRRLGEAHENAPRTHADALAPPPVQRPDRPGPTTAVGFSQGAARFFFTFRGFRGFCTRGSGQRPLWGQEARGALFAPPN